jgi:P27 family predicted phage terminase small subunit
MPAVRKPTAVLAMSGSLSKHKDRLDARANEPVPDPKLGNCPTHLDEQQKLLWKEIVSQIPPYVVTKSDRLLIELAVRCLEKIRNDGKAVLDAEGKVVRVIACSTNTIAQFQKCLSQLGMSPADRSKIQAVPPKGNAADDPFEEFD